MISSFQKVFPEYHPDKQLGESSYVNHITFFVLNLFSVGIIGALETTRLEGMSAQLRHYQIRVMGKNEEMNHTKKGLETDLQALFLQIQTGMSEDETKQAFLKIKERIALLNDHADSSFSRYNNTWAVTKRLFFNVVTLGLYGCFERNRLKQEIAKLEYENAFLGDKFVEWLKHSKENLYQNVNTLEEYSVAREVGRKGLTTNLGEIIVEKMLEAESIKAVCAIEQEELDLAQIENVQLKEAQNLSRSSRGFYEQLQRQVASKQQQLADLTKRIVAAHAKLAEGPLGKKLGAVERIVPLMDEASIAPVIPQDMAQNPYHPSCQGKKTAYEVMESAFEYAFVELLEKSDAKTLPIILNKSADIFTDKRCLKNMHALYRYMAHHLVTHGVILNSHTLQLNDEGLTMVSSCPEYVRTCNTDGDQVKEALVFTHNDLFTPPPGNVLAKGIDPVLAKSVLLKLNDEEKEMLVYLLLEPLIPDEDETLKRYLKTIKGESDSIKKVRACYELICTMGDAIEKKFGPFLGSLWLEHADEYDPDVKPLIKEVEVFAIDTEGQEGAIVDWKMDIESFEKVDRHFAKMMLESQAHYRRIWSNMSYDLVANPLRSEKDVIQLDEHNFKQVLRNQFHMWYMMLDGHFCLMSSLCAITLTDPNQFNRLNVTRIHHAMANHLDRPEVAEKFKLLIELQHSKNIKQYQELLRQQSIRQMLGDLEISLFADLMGIRVVVFCPEDPVLNKIVIDEFGLPIPASKMNCFGPNTKERLYITYQATGIGGGNYFYTFPKLKKRALIGEDKQSVERVENYWTTVQHSYY